MFGTEGVFDPTALTRWTTLVEIRPGVPPPKEASPAVRAWWEALTAMEEEQEKGTVLVDQTWKLSQVVQETIGAVTTGRCSGHYKEILRQCGHKVWDTTVTLLRSLDVPEAYYNMSKTCEE